MPRTHILSTVGKTFRGLLCKSNPYVHVIHRQKSVTEFHFDKQTFPRSFHTARAGATPQGTTPLFPQLSTETHRQRTLIAIDPDSNGAVSSFTWAASPNSVDTTPWGLLNSADITVFDMPTEIWQMRSREKKQPSPEALVELFRSFQVDDALVCAAVEFSTPTHLSGKFAWYDSGFASGMLYGIFHTMNLPYERVAVSSWKKDLGLIKLGKPGSLALARSLFENHQDIYLRYACN
jgi:hypothetical protein